MSRECPRDACEREPGNHTPACTLARQSHGSSMPGTAGGLALPCQMLAWCRLYRWPGAGATATSARPALAGAAACSMLTLLPLPHGLP